MACLFTTSDLKRFAALLCFALAISGCNSDSQSFAPASTSPQLKTHRFDELGMPAIRCQDAKHCPENVGQLVSITLRAPERCTFTLVKPNVILTASHCVPWTNVKRDRTIAGNCWARFPQRSTDQEPPRAIACKSVLEASRLSWNRVDELQTDYAYIELAEDVDRPLAKVSEKAIGSDHLFVFGVHPLEKDEDLVVKMDCKQDLSYSLLTRRETSEDAILMPGCPIRVGNSGGPIYDTSTSEIVGVVSFIDTAPGKPQAGVGTRVPPPPPL